MTEEKQPIETPDDAPAVMHEGDPSRPPELAIVLRDLRRSLLKHPEIAESVRRLCGHVSMRDFYVSMSCLLLGVGGQVYAVQYQPWLVPAFLFIFLVGFAGVSSLAHESWHGRSVSSKRFDRWLSRWVYTPLLMTNNEQLARDHYPHHKIPGEPDDPQAFIWNLSWQEFRNIQISSVLIIPAVYKAGAALFTGKRTDYGFTDSAHKASPRVMVAIILVHLPWALGLLWVSPWAFAFGYLIAMPLGALSAQQRQYREHSRLPDGSAAVYDLLCSNLERILIPGGYFNYHIVHHIFPEIPQRALPRLYDVISKTIDMQKDYYGLSPQLGLKRSYLNDIVVPA
jgi:fatty acid desaturase